MNIHRPFYTCQRSGAEKHRMGRWATTGIAILQFLPLHYPDRRGISLLQVFLISNRKHSKFLRQRYKFFNSSANSWGKG